MRRKGEGGGGSSYGGRSWERKKEGRQELVRSGCRRSCLGADVGGVDGRIEGVGLPVLHPSPVSPRDLFNLISSYHSTIKLTKNITTNLILLCNFAKRSKVIEDRDVCNWKQLFKGTVSRDFMSLTQVLLLELRISLRIFEKVRNGVNWIIKGPRKMIHEKTLTKKSSDTVPVNFITP